MIDFPEREYPRRREKDLRRRELVRNCASICAVGMF